MVGEKKTQSDGIGSDRDEMGNPFLPFNEDTGITDLSLFEKTQKDKIDLALHIWNGSHLFFFCTIPSVRYF